MKYKTLFFLTITLFILSCKDEQTSKSNKEVNIADVLSISVPGSFQLTRGSGVDSYVAYLTNDKADTFVIQYGDTGIINNLYYINPPVFPISQKESVVKTVGKIPSDDEVIFSEYPEQDNEQKIFDKNYFMYDTINGIIVKVVQPKRIGLGITGLYIPRLKNGKSFTIYSKNLDSLNQRVALGMFETIKYR